MKRFLALLCVVPLLCSFLFSCAPTADPKETYGIEVGVKRDDYYQLRQDSSFTSWLLCYDCYEGDNNDIVVARYKMQNQGDIVLEVEVLDIVKPQSKATLERKLRKGMDFLTW